MQAQAIGLRSKFPEFPGGITTVLRDEIRWWGEFSPDDYGRTYSIEMRYRRNDRPQVWVRAPDMHELADGRRLPHVYDQRDQRLCLYVPGCGFWRPDRALSRTILPWTCYWLRLFEMWVVTDVWHERGVHPEPRPKCPIPGDVIYF
jgi:hypothetical protein